MRKKPESKIVVIVLHISRNICFWYSKIKQTMKYSVRVHTCVLIKSIKFLPANSDFCHLLIIFANSLDPVQARQNVRPDLDLNSLTL